MDWKLQQLLHSLWSSHHMTLGRTDSDIVKQPLVSSVDFSPLLIVSQSTIDMDAVGWMCSTVRKWRAINDK